MRRIMTLAGFAALCAATVCGQTNPQPAFEVADVHVSAKGSGNQSMRGGAVGGGRYELRFASMVDLIRTAWGVESDKVMGGPSWLEMDKFDVIAKAPAGSTPEALKLMLQGLLTDRFKLEVHQEDKPVAVYALTVGSGKSQLKAATGEGEGSCQRVPTDTEPGAIPMQAVSCHNMTMTALAEAVRGLAPAYFDSPVVDMTGMKGAWDLDFKWTGRGQLANAGSSGISIYAAMEKLGLKLDQQKISSPVVVVDHVNQKPTENAADVTKRLPVRPTEFEVADIKPTPPGTQENVQMQAGGRIDAQGISLRDLIAIGWDIDDPADVAGEQKWLEDRYTIVAKAPHDVSTSETSGDEDTLRLMLRTLLTDRFRMKTHMEDRPVAVYALLQAKPKMKKADAAERAGCRVVTGGAAGVPSVLSRTIRCQNITMEQFAGILRQQVQGYLDHPVIDASGLEGGWDFDLSFTPKRLVPGLGGGQQGDAAAVPAAPNGKRTVFEAMEKQLGLKLEQQKHAMPVLVVDHVEQKPTDN